VRLAPRFSFPFLRVEVGTLQVRGLLGRIGWWRRRFGMRGMVVLRLPIRSLARGRRFERAAMKWLRRYLEEKGPTLKNFAIVVRSLESGSSRRAGRK
jgi:hypothetical protein